MGILLINNIKLNLLFYLCQVLHEEFQSSWIKRNSLTVLTKPEGLFLRVVSLNTGKVVLESYASTIQPSAVQEMLETLITLSDGYLVTMTTLVSSRLK